MAPPLRVAFILPDFFAGGAQRVLLSFARGLDRSKFEPSVIAVNGNGPWRERFAGDLPIDDLGKSRLAFAYPALVAALRRARPDIVVSTMYHMNLAALACSPWLSGHVRFFAREANMPSAASKGRFGSTMLGLCYRILYARAERVIAPSRLIADELVRNFGIGADRVHVLPNPVDTAPLRRAAAEPLRREGSEPQFVCVGRLSRQKGYDRLIQTIADGGVNCHVTIFGEGPERSSLGAQILHNGLGGKITLAGFESDTPPWLAGADALLLPSRWEGMPNVALEALSLGTPVIAAPEAGGIGEIAAMAKPGDVTLAPMGGHFARAMNAVSVSTGGARRLRESRLPVEFEMNQAVAALEALFLQRKVRECAD